jgi:hypothetical protein
VDGDVGEGVRRGWRPSGAKGVGEGRAGSKDCGSPTPFEAPPARR